MQIPILQCKNRRILIVGDIMLDEYLWCQVKRISPEAPVPVCQVKEVTLVPGGAANVATNVAALDCTPLLFGLIGHDTTAQKLAQLLDGQGIPTQFLFPTRDRHTILKSRVIAHRQHVVRVDREDTLPISKALENKILQAVANELATTDIVLLSDYNKGLLTRSLLKRLIALCTQHQIKIIIDPKGDDYTKYTGAFTLTPNFSEFQEAVGKKLKSEADIQKEAVKLIQRLKLACLIITRSEKGMSIVMADGRKTDMPTRAQEVIDITGAGDTAISTLAVALAGGLSLEDSITMANHAAGIVVGKLGTATTSLTEILDAISLETMAQETMIPDVQPVPQ